MRRLEIVAAVVVVAVGSWWSRSAFALVNSIDATATAEVTEFIDGAEGNSDSAFEDFGETTGNLPLTAEVELFKTVDDQDEAGATATTVFYDPRLSTDSDPDEFSLDVGTFSLAPDMGYLARSASTETRQITFSAAEIGAADGSDLQARSQFFVDGLLLIWGDVGQTDLTGTSAEFALSVVETRPGTAASRVLEVTLTVTGQADGKASVSVSGPLGAANVTVLDLSGTTPDFGPLHLVVIPATTAIPYVYPARVGEAFELKAEIQAKARSQPMTGASVQLGVPLLELSALIDTVTGGASGDLFQQLIQSAVASAPPAAKPLLPSDENTRVEVIRRATPLDSLLASPLCGLLGAESLAMLTMFGVAVGLSVRHKGFAHQ